MEFEIGVEVRHITKPAMENYGIGVIVSYTNISNPTIYEVKFNNFKETKKISENNLVLATKTDKAIEEEKQKELERKQEEEKNISNLQQYFLNNYNYPLDNEQASAILCQNQNVLVSARAGSGKTRTIVAKTIYLIDCESISPKAIQTLTFNNSVPPEINDRIEKIKKNGVPVVEKSEVASTFHSYAIKQSNLSGILEQTFKDNAKESLVESIIDELKDSQPDFKKRIYEHFRNECLSIIETDETNGKKYFSGCKEDYYTSIRNHSFNTLDGRNVKSSGEKWIADFLFEHNINYWYEHTFYPSYIEDYSNIMGPDLAKIIFSGKKRKGKLAPTKPDFYLPDYQLVWEHWGINEHEESSIEKKKFSEKFDETWEEYYDSMRWKRAFWSDWRKALVQQNKYIKEIHDIKGLIETSVNDMTNGREEFENNLEKKLNELGIPCRSLSQSERINKFWEQRNCVTRISSLIVSFINKYQQYYFDKDISQFEMEISQISNEHIAEFYRLGLIVYKRYIEILSSAIKPKRYSKYAFCFCDYNMVVADAIKAIKHGDNDADILKLEYLLIDEYQDFSELFYRLIAEIVYRNPNIKLFCVGDTWQAINRFMGADTKYFENFNTYFKNSCKVTISTNYRSCKKLVDISNHFMKTNTFDGEKANWSNKEKGRFDIIDISNIYIEKNKTKKAYETDRFFIPYGEEKGYVYARYLKKCVEIIEKLPNKGIMILARNHQIFNGRYNLEHDFEKDLSSILKVKGITNPVLVDTIHKTKGDERDVVILIDANQSVIPNIHPDNILFEKFGQTLSNVINDEKRLFYVAITRAKTDLFILYNENPSPFIKQLISTNIDVETF